MQLCQAAGSGSHQSYKRLVFPRYLQPKSKAEHHVAILIVDSPETCSVPRCQCQTSVHSTAKDQNIAKISDKNKVRSPMPSGN
jgi:hypothetical protein